MKTILLATLMATGLAAQQKKSADKDNWQRTKECAAQAEKAANRMDEELIRNHYSAKYERCFMLTLAKDSDHVFRHTLSDAFEGTLLALTITDYRKETKPEDRRACSISDLSNNCSEVEAYIEQHLTE